MESHQQPQVEDEQDVNNHLVENLQDEAVVLSEDDLILTEDGNSGQEHFQVTVKDMSPSATRVTAALTMPSSVGRLDHITFTYKRLACCFTTKKTIGDFAFPRRSWRTQPGGVSTNTSVKEVSMRLDKLSRKDPDTVVTAKGLVAGTTVLKVRLLLGDLLEAMTYAAHRGEWATTLSLVLMHDRFQEGLGGGQVTPSGAGAPSGSCSSGFSLFCNGRRLCGSANAAQLSR